MNPYLQIARPDHWFKNVFMVPGMAVAWFAQPELLVAEQWWRVPLAFVSACLIASSYYTLNEIRDAPFDALHPVKRLRPVPSGQINVRVGYVQCAVLALLGLLAACALGASFLICAAALLAMGGIYNMPPMRSKDVPYVDVLTESINNPLRLLLGWYATGIALMVPASLVLAYWMLGAFFMTVKRLAEFRAIADPVVAAAYRKSFAHYTESRLLVSTQFYAVAFGMALGVFLVRYRVEMVLVVPLLAGFIAWYLHMGLQHDSAAQRPEALYRQHGFMAYTALTLVVMLLLLVIDMPWLADIVEPTINVRGPDTP